MTTTSPPGKMSIGQRNWERATGLTRGRAGTEGVALGGGGTLGLASKPGKSPGLEGGLFMAAPGGAARRFGSPYLEGVPILDDPFELLALLHLQGGGQWSRTDEIILAILIPSLNHLQFRKVTHGEILAASLVMCKPYFFTPSQHGRWLVVNPG